MLLNLGVSRLGTEPPYEAVQINNPWFEHGVSWIHVKRGKRGPLGCQSVTSLGVNLGYLYP